MANDRHTENRFGHLFCFPTAFWASTSGGFRIVSDTLVSICSYRLITKSLMQFLNAGGRNRTSSVDRNPL